MTRMAMRLSDATRQALLQNRSVLPAMACDTDEARFVSARLPHVDPTAVAGLRKYEYIMKVMLRGEPTSPFRVRGVPIHEIGPLPPGAPRLPPDSDSAGPSRVPSSR